MNRVVAGFEQKKKGHHALSGVAAEWDPPVYLTVVKSTSVRPAGGGLTVVR
jgi:hypothetical protein